MSTGEAGLSLFFSLGTKWLLQGTLSCYCPVGVYLSVDRWLCIIREVVSSLGVFYFQSLLFILFFSKIHLSAYFSIPIFCVFCLYYNTIFISNILYFSDTYLLLVCISLSFLSSWSIFHILIAATM